MLRRYAQNCVQLQRVILEETGTIEGNELAIDTSVHGDEERLPKRDIENRMESVDRAVTKTVEVLGRLSVSAGATVLRQVDLEKKARPVSEQQNPLPAATTVSVVADSERNDLVEMTDEERALLEELAAANEEDEEEDEVLIQPAKRMTSVEMLAGLKRPLILDAGPRELRSHHTFWRIRQREVRNLNRKDKAKKRSKLSSDSERKSRGLRASCSFVERAPLPVALRRYLVMEARSYQIFCRRQRPDPKEPEKLAKPLIHPNIQPWKKELPGVNVDATGRPTDHVPGIALGYTFSAKARAQATQEAAAPEKALVASSQGTVVNDRFNKEGRDLLTDEPVPWNVLPRNINFNRDTTWLRPLYAPNADDDEDEEEQQTVEELSGTFYGGSTVREKAIPVDRPEHNNPIAPDLEEWVNRSVFDSVVTLASRSVLCRDLQGKTPHVQFIPMSSNPTVPRCFDSSSGHSLPSSSSSFKFRNPTKAQLLEEKSRKKRNKCGVFVGQAPINKLREQVALYQRMIHQLVGKDADILSHRVIERPNPQGANQPPRRHLIFKVPEENWPVMQQCFHNLLLVENGGAWIATSQTGMKELYKYVTDHLRPHTKAMGSGSAELIEKKRLPCIPQGVLTPGNMLLFESEKDIHEGIQCRTDMLGRHSGSSSSSAKKSVSQPLKGGVYEDVPASAPSSSSAPSASNTRPSLPPGTATLPSAPRPPIVVGSQGGPPIFGSTSSSSSVLSLSSAAPAFQPRTGAAPFVPSNTAAPFVPGGAMMGPSFSGPTTYGRSTGGGALHKAQQLQQQAQTAPLPPSAAVKSTPSSSGDPPMSKPSLNLNATAWTPPGAGGGPPVHGSS